MTWNLSRDRKLNLDDSSDPGRRKETDRRRRATGPLDAFRWGGRRAQVRRHEERQGAYFVDRFDNLTLVLVLSLLGLSLLDGVLTVELLKLNSEEINPAMKFLLNRGYTAFFLGKYLLTAAGLPFLLVYRNYPLFRSRFRAGALFPVFLVLYLVLVTYQLHLFERGRVMP